MSSSGAVDAHGPHSMSGGHNHRSAPQAFELLGQPSDGVPHHARGCSTPASLLGNTSVGPAGAGPVSACPK